jgi:TatD DNase family protein
MLFDTHCHLNFSAFEGRVEQVIKEAKNCGVNYFVIPGTDVENSKKAIKIAEKFNSVYAAVGIHPHHVYKLKVKNSKLKVGREIEEIEELLKHPKVVAVGEIGLDRYIYKKTKYENYQINQEFIKLQKWFFLEQLKLAKEYKKTVIIHNRQAKKDLLELLNTYHSLLDTKIVFHCCEPDDDLLNFAIKNNIFIGIDGDVTYNKKKQEFVKKIPLSLLVLETDSPFLKPRVTSLLRSDKDTTLNEPKNILIIAQFLAQLLKIKEEEIKNNTFKNSLKLFNIEAL